MKRILLVLLSLCMACPCFAGCGVDREAGTVKIGYWAAGYGEEFMEYWTEEYNKAHPDEQINFEIDSQVTASSIGTSLENKAGLCDIYLSLATDWSGWARSGWIEPLDDLMETANADGVVIKDAFRGGMERYGALDGHQYVWAQSGPAANGFIYSHKLFTEKGWIVPTTVDELFTLIDQINNDPVNKDGDKTNDIAPFAWGGQVMAYWNAVVQLWANQYDGVEKCTDFYENPSLDKYKYENREGVKKALEIFERMICTGEGVPKNSLQGAMSKTHTLMQNDFVQGKAAMLSGAYGVVNETKSIIDDDFDMRMFFPAIDGADVGEDGKPLMITVANEFDFMFIAKDSPEKELAKKFLSWISTKKMAAGYLKYTASFPSFEFDREDVTGISTLTQSIMDHTDDHLVMVMGVTDNPLTKLGKITFWPAGEPYTSMVIENNSVKKVMETQYAYASSKWQEWSKSAGLE